MKNTIILSTLAILLLSSCVDRNDKATTRKDIEEAIMKDSIEYQSGYAKVNGIKMYYEIYGQGRPLVLIHGGGSTIQSTFGRIIPQLAKHYKLIAVELQNHGRSGFRSIPQTFVQDADDVAALLDNLEIRRTSFFGFSNGGSTAMQIAIRHPEIVDRLVVAAGAYQRDGFVPGFFDGMEQATLENMPQELKTAFLKVNPDTAKLKIMFEKDRDRMIAFEDWRDEQVRSIAAPTLLINGDADVVRPEHAVEMYRLIPDCRLAIIPGTHGEYLGEVTTLNHEGKEVDFVVQMIKKFLDKK